ncbi:PREDICTED: uncharacterized protein LOC108559950 isoform X2 [Nicrophorus vespilloides]|uniref:Uncharacterized protein LOC108559950 isoform X2 n=1 Tax=Nicrophorus vespilloides TaxID=110193 RepID=A0ABM1ME31_NICVS|nr:PREDICTED: uncharacterized protein LOC108559950 isoform X2 [Nicrophorus vespilloides]
MPLTTQRRPLYPGSLTDLHRFRKTAHGHDGSSRIVMVRKTDQRTFASIQNGKEPKLETITRETIETFRGPRTACKITTEKKGCEFNVPANVLETLTRKSPVAKAATLKKSPTVSFNSECLRAHNEYRQRHGVTPLKLSKEMCRISQDFANYLIRKTSLEHSNNQRYGENIYCLTMSKEAPIKGGEPVKHWYSEISKHDFKKEPTSLESGHFTQVVWSETKELGVGHASYKGKIIVVANYYPPGNVIGHYLENVPSLLDVEVISEAVSSIGLSGKRALSAFRQECLEAHNKYRAKHGVPPLQLDNELSRYSDEWAKICADRSTLEHRKNNQYGENIYSLHTQDTNIKGSVPVDSWYTEKNKFGFGKEPKNLEAGHFTQIIWKTTERLGVGVAIKPGGIYVVCNYSPAGNFVGYFAENVLPLGTVLKDEKTKQTFELEALKVHNDYRRKHGAPELTLNQGMCDYAKQWAENCANRGISRRPNNPYGENIYMSYSSDYSYTPGAREVVAAWYDECKVYAYGNEGVQSGALHFTQIVWKGTSELGIGYARNNRGEMYVVANYSPRGNFVGQFLDNVQRPHF